MAAALAAAGFDPDRLAEARIDPAGVHALVELHIEQGIVLETHGEQVGVVTAIAAPHDFRLTFRARPPTRAPRRWACAATRWPARPRRWCASSARRASRQRDDGRHGGRAARAARGDQRRPGEVELDVDVRDSDLARASRWCRPSWPPPREIGAARPRGRGDADRRGRAGDLRRGVVAAAQEACRELDLSCA
jgi:hypothetical protein